MDYIYDVRDPLRYFLRDADLLPYLRAFREVLKVRKLSNLKYLSKEDLVHIGFTLSERKRYKKTYKKYFPHSYFDYITGFFRKEKMSLKRWKSASSVEIQQFSEYPVKVPRKHVIPMKDIEVNIELGEGQFGIVQQGTWTSGNQRTQVAIKCLKPGMASNSMEFLKEAAVMHSIEHPNIVRLFGAVIENHTLMLVTELAPLRSLLECLRQTELRTNFSVMTLCNFAEQICDGMAYLENNRLIHRDLAARNILVFSKNKVKISDFGLSRVLRVGKDYYQTNYSSNLKLPVAWCAPECILYLRFTSASDVWAFGVCLWEMFTYGFQPWAALSGQKILEAIDNPNPQRLDRPDCCPEFYYSLMLDTWAHDPQHRPAFTALTIRLRANRPEEVITLSQFRAPDEMRRVNFLNHRERQIITVLGKENLTNTAMWYGVLHDGTYGMFDPKNTETFVSPEPCWSDESLSPELDRRSTISIPSLLRSDVKRHTYTGKRNIQADMISAPQGDMMHTGHVGLDGTLSGDISFLDLAGCDSRQAVRRPRVDSEQVPLINPNSPSRLKSSSDIVTPFPLNSRFQRSVDSGEANTQGQESKKAKGKKAANKAASDPTKSGNLIKRVRSATFGLTHKTSHHKMAHKQDEVHEYQEIVDPDTVISNAENNTSEVRAHQDSPSDTNEVQDSLLEKMEILLRNIEEKRKESPHWYSQRRPFRYYIDLPQKHHNSSGPQKPAVQETNNCEISLGTMKQMSVQEEKMLNTAVAMANEITSKSMNDLDGSSKPAASPSDKHKLNFKFGQLSLNNYITHESDKDATGKQERRNFCDEAKAKAKDIQSTITKESKAAYVSLIEEPTPSTSQMIQVTNNGQFDFMKSTTMPKPHDFTISSNILRPEITPRPATMPRPAPVPRPPLMPRPATSPRPPVVLRQESDDVPEARSNPHLNTGARPKERPAPQVPAKKSSRRSQKPPAYQSSFDETDGFMQFAGVNAVALPPKLKDTILVDKPRHIRKHPLKIPSEQDVPWAQPIPGASTSDQPNIYQNTARNRCSRVKCTQQRRYLEDLSPPSSTYNFKSPTEERAMTFNTYDNKKPDEADQSVERALLKDYVSVEDLLEFADQKPCGRQRGVESDEVRIMMKMFNDSVTSNQCLEALDMCNWEVYKAFKLLSIKMTVGEYVDLIDCYSELLRARGDIAKAVSLLSMQRRF